MSKRLRLGLFVDVRSIFTAVHQKFPGHKLSYPTMVSYLSDIGDVVQLRAYGVISDKKAFSFVNALKAQGFDYFYLKVIEREDGSKMYPSIKLDLVMDVIDNLAANEFDCVVLVTNDTEFATLARRIRTYDKSLIVIGAAIPPPLLQHANEFIDIPESWLIGNEV